MKRVMNFIFGLAIGGVVGATVALLITPTSGEDIRTQLQARVLDLQQEVQAAAQTRRADLEAQLATLRQPQKHQLQ